MTQKLFREEVTNSRQTSWLEGVNLTAPRMGWCWFFIALSIIVIGTLLLSLGSFDRHTHVQGVLVPNTGLVDAAAEIDGVIDRILVREGDRVVSGQPLVVISGERSSLGSSATYAGIDEQLHLQLESVQEDIRNLERSERASTPDLADQLRYAGEQKVRLAAQIATLTERERLASELYRSWEHAGSTGVVSKLQILQQHDAALQIKTELEEQQRQDAAIAQEIARLKAAIDEQSYVRRSRLNESKRALADIEAKIARNNAEQTVVLRAANDGTVVNLLASVGRSVNARQSLVTILPSNAELQAELWVPSSAVGLLSKGARAVIRYDSFPYQKYGQAIGAVSEISSSAVSPDDLGRMLGRRESEARYRVVLSLENQDVKIGHGRIARLLPGMSLNADIVLERHSIFSWLVNSLAI